MPGHTPRCRPRGARRDEERRPFGRPYAQDDADVGGLPVPRIPSARRTAHANPSAAVPTVAARRTWRMSGSACQAWFRRMPRGTRPRIQLARSARAWARIFDFARRVLAKSTQSALRPASLVRHDLHHVPAAGGVESGWSWSLILAATQVLPMSVWMA